MKTCLKRWGYVLLCGTIVLLLCSSCVTLKEFFKGFSDGNEGYYNGDYYDDGYKYGDEDARDEFMD